MLETLTPHALQDVLRCRFRASFTQGVLSFLLSFSGDELANCLYFQPAFVFDPLALILQFPNDEHLPKVRGKQNKPATSNSLAYYSTIHELKLK